MIKINQRGKSLFNSLGHHDKKAASWWFSKSSLSSHIIMIILIILIILIMITTKIMIMIKINEKGKSCSNSPSAIPVSQSLANWSQNVLHLDPHDKHQHQHHPRDHHPHHPRLQSCIYSLVIRKQRVLTEIFWELPMRHIHVTSAFPHNLNSVKIVNGMQFPESQHWSGGRTPLIILH